MKWQRLAIILETGVFAVLNLTLAASVAAAQQGGAGQVAASRKPAAAAPETVGGTGKPGYIPVWTNTTTLGDSLFFQKGTDVGLGTTSPTASLEVVSPNTTGAPAILGDSTATSGDQIGVEGIVNSNAAYPDFVIGVNGISYATSGNTAGVVGDDSNPDGAGTWGQSFAASGGRGVEGIAYSGSGTGVRGDTTGLSTTVSFALEGVANGPNDYGMAAYATDTAGTAIAVYGQAWSATGTAGLFDNLAGGNILIGQNNGANVFRVNGAGKGFFDGGTQIGGADFAESVAVRGDRSRYQPGDLLVIDAGGQRRLALAQKPYSPLVAGIYSTKPGVLATTHAMDNAGLATEVPLAVVGIVPCKVTAQNGGIAVGDLLVASSKPGYAMKGTDRSRMLGAVVGKALEPLRAGSGVIQVLVTLQ
jgi:hypothetical protein